MENKIRLGMASPGFPQRDHYVFSDLKIGESQRRFWERIDDLTVF